MTTPTLPPKRIAIVGGGITGLAAAYRLRELDPNAAITLYEAGARLGGILRTMRRDGLLIEHSADNFISNVPWGLDLCRRLGIESELLTTNESGRQAFVVHRGQLVKVPQGFMLMAPTKIGPILTTPLLSLGGKLRLLAEWLIPPRKSIQDESLSSFVRRRFGREVFERLVQPLIGGIYTADPEKLSLAATLPRFLEMEQQHGSVIRGSRKANAKSATDREIETSGARYSLFVAPRGGMSALVERLAEQLPSESLKLNTVVDRVERTAKGTWQLTLLSSAPGEPLPPERVEFDAAIVAVPAFRAAKLLGGFDASLAADLDQIPYAGISIVALVYRRADIEHPLDGFGIVIPAIEHRQILAASFASNKFPDRAPDDQVLIRVFIGGACQPDLAELPDERLRAIATTEMADLLEIHGEPLTSEIIRWPRSMPQYHLGHLALVERIEKAVAQHPGLAIAGNAYHGVGVPNCIHSGEQAAEKITTLLPRDLKELH